MATLVDPWGGVYKGLESLQETLKAVPQMKAAQMTLEEMYENKKIRSEIGIANQEAQAKYQKDLTEYNTTMSRYRPGEKFEKLGTIVEQHLPEPKKPDETANAESILRKYGRWEEAEKIKSYKRQQQFDTIKLAIDAADKGQEDFAKWIMKGNRDLFGEEMPDISGIRKIATNSYEATEENTGIKHIITVKRDERTGEFIGVEDVETIKTQATPKEKIETEVETATRKKEAELEVEKRLKPEKITEGQVKGEILQKYVNQEKLNQEEQVVINKMSMDDVKAETLRILKESLGIGEARRLGTKGLIKRFWEVYEGLQTPPVESKKDKETKAIEDSISKQLTGKKADTYRFKVDGTTKRITWDGTKITKTEDE